MSDRKVAMVTGGGSGIGKAIAGRFVAEDYLTVITGRNEARLVQAARNMGKLCMPIVHDLADLESIPALVKKVAEFYGSIDVLVNNAGINQKKSILDVSDTEFQNIITVNQTALFALTREVVRHMYKTGNKGTVINISSMAAHYGIPKVIAYSASKAAAEGMTRAMAVELAPLGIRVNCVAPGFITTPMSRRALDSDSERKNRALARTPMGRMGSVKEVANAVFFLASDEASYINGEVIRVDGGNAIGF